MANTTACVWHPGFLTTTIVPTEFWHCPACSLLGKAWARTTAQPRTRQLQHSHAHYPIQPHSCARMLTVTQHCLKSDLSTTSFLLPTAFLSKEWETPGVKAGDNLIAVGATDRVPEHPGASSPSYSLAPGELLEPTGASPAARQEFCATEASFNLYAKSNTPASAAKGRLGEKKMKCLKVQGSH